MLCLGTRLLDIFFSRVSWLVVGLFIEVFWLEVGLLDILFVEIFLLEVGVFLLEIGSSIDILFIEEFWLEVGLFSEIFRLEVVASPNKLLYKVFCFEVVSPNKLLNKDFLVEVGLPDGLFVIILLLWIIFLLATLL